MLCIAMLSLSLGVVDEICVWIKKMFCFLECCSNVEISSQNVSVWRPNCILTISVGSHFAEFYRAFFLTQVFTKKVNYTY